MTNPNVAPSNPTNQICPQCRHRKVESRGRRPDGTQKYRSRCNTCRREDPRPSGRQPLFREIGLLSPNELEDLNDLLRAQYGLVVGHPHVDSSMYKCFHCNRPSVVTVLDGVRYQTSLCETHQAWYSKASSVSS